MSTSKVELFNIALGRVGEGYVIQHPDEDSQPARECRRFYDMSRKQTLRAFDWPWATRAVNGTRLADGPLGAKWSYFYAIPSESLKVIGVYNQYGRKVPFQITSMQNDIGTFKTVATNEETPILYYVVNVEDASQYDPLFADALAWRLASELAPVRTENNNMRSDALQMWSGVIEQAKSSNLSESYAYPEPSPSMIARQ